MKKLLGISLVAMMAVTTARADIASKAYVDPTANGNFIRTTNTTGQNLTALDTALTLPEGSDTVAEAIAAAIQDADPSETLGGLEDRIDALESGKADKATTLAGYGIADAYTKTETDTALGLKEDKANKVTAVSSTSTDTEYPSAKAVYTAVEGAKTASTDAISALDMVAADTTGTGNVVTSVNQVNGKVTAEKNMTAIPQPTATNATGVLVLTATSDGNGGYTYQWENIARGN